MENINDKQALILAESLTKHFNKFDYTYSMACWEAHNIFIAKGLVNYMPHVIVMHDGKLKVGVEKWKS